VNDDYLWDRSGEPDAEVARLESLLERYRHDDKRTAAVPTAGEDAGGPRRRRIWPFLAAAAALVLVVGGALLAYRFLWKSGEAWPVTIVSGTTTRTTRLGVGDELRTDAHTRAIVQIARVGEVEIGPGSSVRLITTTSRRHILRLDRGTLVARTWAPPFTFAVDTPSGLASDIGCAFTLHHADDLGQLHVTSGWVDFDGRDRSSLIPAGAVTELRNGNPGSPHYADAPPALRAALHAYDFEHGPLEPILASVRRRDALTLLHLLERVAPEKRGLVFDTLARLAPPPREVTRAGIINGELEMVDAWRHSLGLGGYKKWWLYWRDAL